MKKLLVLIMFSIFTPYIEARSLIFYSDNGDGISNSNDAIKIWDIKTNSSDYIMENKINNAIAEEGLNIIKENFPDVYNNVDKKTLKNIILLNVSKNTAYEN